MYDVASLLCVLQLAARAYREVEDYLGYQSCTTLTFSDALCFRLHLRKTGGFPIHKASGWYKEPSNPQGHHQASKATAAPAPTVLHSRVGLGGGSSTASISTPFLLTSMAFEECVILGLEAHVATLIFRINVPVQLPDFEKKPWSMFGEYFWPVKMISIDWLDTWIYFV